MSELDELLAKHKLLLKEELKELILNLIDEADGSTVKYGDLLPEIRKRIRLL